MSLSGSRELSAQQARLRNQCYVGQDYHIFIVTKSCTLWSCKLRRGLAKLFSQIGFLGDLKISGLERQRHPKTQSDSMADLKLTVLKKQDFNSCNKEEIAELKYNLYGNLRRSQ